MAKKIHIHLRDEFKPSELDRLSALLIRTLHAEFPGFIVHTDVKKKFREPFIVYVYGLWAEGENDATVAAAGKTVGRLLSNISWRQEFQPAPPPREESFISNDDLPEQPLKQSEE